MSRMYNIKRSFHVHQIYISMLVKMEVVFVVVLALQLLASQGQAQQCGKNHYALELHTRKV